MTCLTKIFTNTLVLVMLSFTWSCGSADNGSIDQPDEPVNGQPVEQPGNDAPDYDDGATYEPVSNSKYNLSTEIPDSWQSYGSSPGSNLTIFNLYKPLPNARMDLPLNIHTDAAVRHVSFFPQGLGTEYPNGDSKALTDYRGEVPVDFALNRSKSRVFMLENGEPWAYLLTPASAPAGWNSQGFLFAQMSVNNFEARCFDRNGQEKPLQQCEVMGGSDEIRYYGTVDPRAHREVTHVLQHISWQEGSNGDGGDDKNRRAADMIKVDRPSPNMNISSPLTVRGQARGTYFFEASFPVILEDKDGNVLAQAPAQAKGEWMTKDFVPFSVTLEFNNAPDDERGYLVFQRANPSGMPENAMSYRIPVLFPPK